MSSEVCNDFRGYRGLWASVLIQAIKDVDSKEESAAAKEWIFDTSENEGSIYWICSTLDLDCGRIQTMCLSRKGRWKILGTQHANLVLHRDKALANIALTIAERKEKEPLAELVKDIKKTRKAELRKRANALKKSAAANARRRKLRADAKAEKKAVLQAAVISKLKDSRSKKTKK